MSANTTMTDIRHTFTLNAPIEKVWNAISTSEGLASWLMDNDFRPEVGAAFTFRTEAQGDFDGIVHCEVLELKEPTLVSFTWNSPAMGVKTIVTLELRDLSGQTEFTLTHAGWEQLPEALLPVRNMLAHGWTTHMEAGLRQALEQM